MKYVAIIYAWTAIIYACASPQERAEQAIVLGLYERELDACREQGKASGSYAVYKACADATDRKLCATRGVRCIDAGAP